MAGASPQGAPVETNIFNLGDTLKKLHQLALLSKQDLQQTFEEGTLAVAILDHNANPDPCIKDIFHWFKLKPNHSVGKLKKAYFRKNKVQVTLKHASTTLSDETQMSNVVHLTKNTIVFTSEIADMNNSAPSSSASVSTPIRNPLQPINAQLPANGSANPLVSDGSKTKIKTEETFLSPRLVNKNMTADIKPNLSRTQTPYGPFHPGAHLSDPQDNSAAAQAGPANTPAAFEHASNGSSSTEASSSTTAPPNQSSFNERIQKLILEGTPEVLEAEVRQSQVFLEGLRRPMAENSFQHQDAQHWVKQIENLQNHNINTPTIIGVVGNTGAGKSSVINAMLEEERLLPTNCMRACTACVTEMSWNTSDEENSRYRADIEFIKADDWKKDLELSLHELLDSNGQVSRDCTNAETEAGVAYAKIKAVYPNKSKDELAKCTIEQLMREPTVKDVLGTTKKIARGDPSLFYKSLQHFVDSKEKVTSESKDSDKKDKKEKVKKTMEFWPLIKVVRIYTKADCLSTGAVIVDLPGVHDSNAARAAVAAGYMKQCTGLFIVAPINRAVDDKAAKSLLGESFKRQLKFDGQYSRITFICSKTDDISLIEATDSLGLEDEMAADWEKIDELESKQKSLKQEVKDLKESKEVYTEIMGDADDKIEEWEKLKDDLEAGETVYAPGTVSKKRKRSSKKSKTSRKKSKKTDSDDEDDGHVDDDSEEDEQSDDESDSESTSEGGDPLTVEEIDTKITMLKEDKKKARRERGNIDKTLKEKNQEIKELLKSQTEIETAMTAICIDGRNKYSKGAIQRDFADGIRELDQEAAQEEDPDQFNPEDELRDYDEVARTLPVFCVSSRAYQKMQGRLQRDNAVPGFRSPEETEVPQLQAHCKKLTEAGRASNCRAYLTNLCQLLTSLGLWASNDGTGMNMTDAQLAAETRFLKSKLKSLEQGLEGAVKDCLKEMNETLSDQIFENFDSFVNSAVEEAPQTVSRWHLPVNRENQKMGGYYWSSYKAIVRRNGVYSNDQGPHDFNADLIEPIIKQLASHWERCFQQRMPRLLASFTRQAKSLLAAFHREIELRSMKSGTGAAGLMLLSQQLKNYDALFVALATQMTELVTTIQRDANREFTPVIARSLAEAYEFCTNERGSGCYARMKSFMSNFVNDSRNEMFSESCNEVKKLLLAMSKQVEDKMATQADEVYLSMQRDYMQVIAGTALPEGQTMPKWERKMRSDVVSILENQDQALSEEAKVAKKEDEQPAAVGSGTIPTSKDFSDAEDEGNPLSKGYASSPSLEDMDLSL
ncbi:uncharacterized protein LY89DRAFT_714238 [Mollisia scopiformis]|uniref:Nuclear GTPase SLIP-GC n=1 Tax=Mollisia scopiformis TaxID=149040 RepID=A0A194XQJ5_MOLSC|nr:uncharacterized protein LY89DRAFT_714238 [Mollisia scopiformis]KUJ22436.1 hypothetical protein LY89DRAFT_714238 [Mollisia scopiformis]